MKKLVVFRPRLSFKTLNHNLMQALFITFSTLIMPKRFIFSLRRLSPFDSWPFMTSCLINIRDVVDETQT